MRFIKFILFFLLLVVSSKGYSQLSKTHYIPPLTESGENSSNPADQYIYISTPSATNVKFTIKPIGFKLLPRKFTMLQLQYLYETILNKKVDKRNFITKINSLNILIKLHEKSFGTSKKGSFLYMYDKEEYEEKLSNGFTFKL